MWRFIFIEWLKMQRTLIEQKKICECLKMAYVKFKKKVLKVISFPGGLLGCPCGTSPGFCRGLGSSLGSRAATQSRSLKWTRPREHSARSSKRLPALKSGGCYAPHLGGTWSPAVQKSEWVYFSKNKPGSWLAQTETRTPMSAPKGRTRGTVTEGDKNALARIRLKSKNGKGLESEPVNIERRDGDIRANRTICI